MTCQDLLQQVRVQCSDLIAQSRRARDQSDGLRAFGSFVARLKVAA